MSPALESGDYIITIKPRTLRAGLIYVINHSDLGRIVKRIERIDNGRVIAAGDNPGSTPSAVIGPIESHRVAGRAFVRISKSGISFL